MLPVVRGDRVQIQQVVLNLIINSFEAMKDAELKKMIVRTSIGKEGFITVSIEDSGAGIDKKPPALLFEPFYTTKKEGLGMGLAINKAIIETHGGSIWARNNADKGAVFYFTLPLAEKL